MLSCAKNIGVSTALVEITHNYMKDAGSEPRQIERVGKMLAAVKSIRSYGPVDEYKAAHLTEFATRIASASVSGKKSSKLLASRCRDLANEAAVNLINSEKGLKNA